MVDGGGEGGVNGGSDSDVIDGGVGVEQEGGVWEIKVEDGA